MADRANAPVPLQNLRAKIAWVATEASFVDTPIRTEGKAPRWNFQATPTAEPPPVVSFRQNGANGDTAQAWSGRYSQDPQQIQHKLFETVAAAPGAALPGGNEPFASALGRRRRPPRRAAHRRTRRNARAYRKGRWRCARRCDASAIRSGLAGVSIRLLNH